MSLPAKVALVTGAGSGIGRASALRLAREGASVVPLGHRLESAEEVAEEIRAAGGMAHPLAADVEDAAAMRDVVAEIDGVFGRLDIVIANAGINGVWAALTDLEPEEWHRTIDVNLTGTFHTVKYATPLLVRAGGAVVIVSSINGTRTFSNTGASAYAASKAGQVAFAKMAAVELAEHGVRVNVVCPGSIETAIEDNTEARGTEELGAEAVYPEGQIPLTGHEPGSSDQVADLVLFLVSDASSHITGTEVFIDGAQSLLI